MGSSLIDQIKDKLNIVDVVSEYIDLSKKGSNFWGICPFHEDTNPSMSVSPEKQMFKCFVCGQGGNAINFVSEFEKITFGKALRQLGDKVGVKVEDKFEEKSSYSEKQQALINVLNDANDFFQYSITSTEGEKALKYAESRKLTTKIREKFKIGYAPQDGLINYLRKKGHDDSVIINAALMSQHGNQFYKNRLMYAISNRYGDVVAFSGRSIDQDGPKYINSIDSLVFNKSSILYNFNNAKDTILKEKEVYILEGFMDVIAFEKANIKNSVAIMGTALTEKHIKDLKDSHAILMLDSDEAGINASLKSIKLLLRNKLPVSIIYNKDGKDADEIVETKGVKGLKEIINTKVSALKFIYAVLKRKHSNVLNTPEGISDFIKEFTNYLPYVSDLEKDFYVNKISEDLKVSSKIVSSMIPSYKKTTFTLPKAQEKTLEIPTLKNHSYILIRSMLKKPMLVDLLKENEVHFSDIMLSKVTEYIIALKKKQNIKIDSEVKEKVQEIIKDSNEVVSSPEEFGDLINIINNNAKNVLKSSVVVKLNKADTTKDKANLLEQLIEIQRKKKKRK